MKSSAMKMKHDVDPAQELLSKIGDLSDIELMHNNILVAVYIRPEKTASGIHLPDTNRKEDEYQGKVGLVVKQGPLAFKDDKNFQWGGQSLKTGDWVCFRVSDGWQMKVNGVLCRVFEEVHIRGKLAAPDAIW